MPETPPNIVLILVDDADTKVLEHAASARIRAALGVGDPESPTATATRYLNTHPLCGPSRATILRGMYPQNTGVVGNNGAYGAFLSHNGDTSNIARWLKAAPTPYRTGMIGKLLNGYRPADDKGDVQDGRADLGFDYWFGVGHDAYRGDDFWAWDDYAPGNDKIVYYGSQHLQHPENYLTNVISTKALQFLDDVATSEPFFLVLTPMAPHSPSNPLDQDFGLYDGEPYPKNTNLSFNEADVSDKPFYISMLPLLDQDQIDAIDDRYARRLECMLSVGRLVQAVVDKLNDIDPGLSNTYVFFTSDHGFHMGEHRLGNEISQDDAEGTAPGGKNSMYEEDIRVPLWVRGPDVTVDTIDELVGSVDLAPTFKDIAGLSPTSNSVDGRSFLPLLRGQSVPWRSQYLISRGQTKPYRGIRHADEWVFGQLITPATYEIEGEYYEDLDDPLLGRFQLDNGYLGLCASRLVALQNLTSDYSQCAGASCRVYDSQPI
jgi:arylsulfatase A-like enzyme